MKEEEINTWERRKRYKRILVPPPGKIHGIKNKYKRKTKHPKRLEETSE